MKRNRIEWIDLAKGMSIILVVYGHCGLASIPYLGDWFPTFHMPFFFLISGLLFSIEKYPTFSSFIAKRWKTLIRPYFIFSMICLCAYWWLNPTQIAPLTKQKLVYGWGGMALWFIPVLTATEIVYYFIKKYLHTDKLVATALLISASIGWIASQKNLPNYYNMWFVCTAVLFYGGGNCAAHISNACSTKLEQCV